jgi:hypothetical protein
LALEVPVTPYLSLAALSPHGGWFRDIPWSSKGDCPGNAIQPEE